MSEKIEIKIYEYVMTFAVWYFALHFIHYLTW